MSKLLELVLSATPLDAADWWRATRPVRAAWAHSVDRAIALGAHADRLGTAFHGGYTAAVAALDPSLAPGDVGALCATEAGGGHPRAVLTSLVDGALTGEKHFVSGGSRATVLLVVARVGEQDGRPSLKVARVRAHAPGVTITDASPLGFVPEVPHGVVTLSAAPAEAVLEGDGYERYLKPFRTIEDLHVFGAIAACLVANGKGRLPQDTTEQLLGVIASLSALGREDARAPSVHLALAGVLGTVRGLVGSLGDRFEPAFGERFARDLPLLRVAQRAREQRRVKAWELVR